MFKIAILTSDISQDYASADLFEAGADRAEVACLNPIDLQSLTSNQKNLVSAKKKLLNYFDALILRRLNQNGDVELQFEMLQRLEANGALLVNSTYSLQISESKYLTNYLLAQFGLPVIEALVTQDKGEALRFAARYEEAVVKPIYRDLGTGISRIEANITGEEKINELLDSYGSVFLQRYIESRSQDIRAFVLGDRVVAAIKRFARPGEWRTNVFLGGKARKITLNQELRDMAIKASQILGLDYAGVDLISDGQRYYILEVNGSPSWKALKEVTGRNVAFDIISLVLRKLHQKFYSRIFTVS